MISKEDYYDLCFYLINNGDFPNDFWEKLPNKFKQDYYFCSLLSKNKNTAKYFFSFPLEFQKDREIIKNVIRTKQLSRELFYRNPQFYQDKELLCLAINDNFINSSPNLRPPNELLDDEDVFLAYVDNGPGRYFYVFKKILKNETLAQKMIDNIEAPALQFDICDNFRNFPLEIRKSKNIVMNILTRLYRYALNQLVENPFSSFYSLVIPHCNKLIKQSHKLVNTDSDVLTLFQKISTISELVVPQVFLLNQFDKCQDNEQKLELMKQIFDLWIQNKKSIMPFWFNSDIQFEFIRKNPQYIQLCPKNRFCEKVREEFEELFELTDLGL